MREVMLVDVLTESGGSIKTGPFGTALKAAEYSLSGVPVISVGEVGHGVLRVADGTPRVDAEVVKRLPEYVLKAGDVVFGRKGAVDRSAWVRPHEAGYFLGSDGIRVRFGSSVDSRFMAYQFRSARTRDWLVQHAGGTTMPSLNQPTLERIPITLPPLDEQRAIAEVLGALDDKIAVNAALASSVDALLSVRYELLVRGCDRTDLASIATVNESSVRARASGQLRYLDIASVAIGRYDFPDPMPWCDAPGRARRVVRPGDTVWSTVRPNRRSHALVLDQDLIASTGLAVITPKRGRFACVYEATRLPEFTSFLESVAEGSAYPAVRGDRFLSAPVPELPEEAQEAFECVAAPLRRRSHSAFVESRFSARLRDALLPGLISGRIRVKDAERFVGEAV